MWKIKRGAFIKLLISQLLTVIMCQTCFFLLNAKQNNYMEGQGVPQ